MLAPTSIPVSGLVPAPLPTSRTSDNFASTSAGDAPGSRITNASPAARTFQRYSQRRTQRGKFRWIVQVARLYRWIPIQHRLAIFRHPARQSLAHWNLERREHPVILAIDILRDQAIFTANPDSQRMM